MKIPVQSRHALIISGCDINELESLGCKYRGSPISSLLIKVCEVPSTSPMITMHKQTQTNKRSNRIYKQKPPNKGKAESGTIFQDRHSEVPGQAFTQEPTLNLEDLRHKARKIRKQTRTNTIHKLANKK
ncbi:hypothetical protein HanPI659440_Chr14g0526391 [Helianthus annuus]|nr:hypothetical protein HanPI659440_Chr14g0526391 [Helianthus annuus]